MAWKCGTLNCIPEMHYKKKALQKHIFSKNKMSGDLTDVLCSSDGCFLYCFALLNCSLVAEVQVSNGSYLRKAAVRRFSLKQALSLQPAWSLHHLNLVAGFSWGSLSHLLCKLPSTLKADSSFLDLDALFHKSNHLIPVKHRWPVSFVVESWLRHYMSWRAVDCSVVAAIDNAAASVLTFFFSV